MRRLIDDAGPRQQPLEIFQEKIPVLKKSQHAEVHADACDQPAAFCPLVFRFADLAAEPEIHRGGREEESGKGWVPGAIKNVARHDE